MNWQPVITDTDTNNLYNTGDVPYDDAGQGNMCIEEWQLIEPNVACVHFRGSVIRYWDTSNGAGGVASYEDI